MGSKLNFTSLKNFVFLYLSLRVFTEGLEEFLIQPTAWYYMKYLGESDLFLGLTLAAYSAGALLFAPFVGVIDVKFQASKLITVFCAFVRFFGNLLYSIPVNGYFPMFGRLISGLGAATDGIVLSIVAKGTTDKNRAKAFLYLEALYSLGTICGPTLGSALTINMDIYGLKINAGIIVHNN
jgi:MFS family permease